MTTKTRRPRRPAGSRAAPIQSDIGSAFDAGRQDVTDLKEEIEAWKDGLEGNNMEHLPKYEEVSECYDALDSAIGGLEGIEVPDCMEGFDASYTQDTRQSAQSRAGRLNNAMAALDAVKSACEQWLEEFPELEATDTDDEDAPVEGDDDFIDEAMVQERETQRGEVEEFQTELENAYSELENVSFPGMY